MRSFFSKISFVLLLLLVAQNAVALSSVCSGMSAVSPSSCKMCPSDTNQDQPQFASPCCCHVSESKIPQPFTQEQSIHRVQFDFGKELVAHLSDLFSAPASQSKMVISFYNRSDSFHQKTPVFVLKHSFLI